MEESKEKKEKNKVKQIIVYIITLLCLILCLYIVIEVISANSNKRPPSIFGLSISNVPTASMEPTIKTGDYIMFSKADYDDVGVNDIIVYYSKKNDIFIVHRIIAKNDYYITCKGDNNSIPDSEEITPDMVRGKFITTLSMMGMFSGGFNTNIIFFILVFIFVIMIGMQVFSMVMKHKNDKLKEEQEKKKELLREELRKEILAEEIKKLKEAKEKEETDSK